MHRFAAATVETLGERDTVVELGRANFMTASNRWLSIGVSGI